MKQCSYICFILCLFLRNQQSLGIQHKLDVVGDIATFVLDHLHLDNIVLEPQGDDYIDIVLELGKLNREVVGIEDDIVCLK